MRVHLGCGSNILPGWLNVDVKPFDGVDQVLDVRQGLPFDDVHFLFAEHFLEHLSLDEGLALLADCRRVLRDDGVLRLSTPNLDWVWVTSYASRWSETGPTSATIDARAWRHDETAATDCLKLNRAFRAWGHRFLWNAGMLEQGLRRAGFAVVEWSEYGQSDHLELAGLERHERYDDSPGLRHVLIAEASGVSTAAWSDEVDRIANEYRRDAGLD
jgi:predicted SAM-dependent methyltransferase